MALLGYATTGRNTAPSQAFLPRDRIMHRRRRSQTGISSSTRIHQFGPRLRNADERFIAACLDASRPSAADLVGTTWEYEPDELPTGLTGRGLRGIRPDFKVERYGPKFYIEVTADPERKDRRIRGAETCDYEVCILLIGPTQLRELRENKYLIHELIEQKLSSRGHARSA